MSLLCMIKKKNWLGLRAENPTEQVYNQEINFLSVSWFQASFTKLTAILNSRRPETQFKTLIFIDNLIKEQKGQGKINKT